MRMGLACQGTALLWRGDFQNARQMLYALAARADRPQRKPKKPAISPMPPSELLAELQKLGPPYYGGKYCVKDVESLHYE